MRGAVYVLIFLLLISSYGIGSTFMQYLLATMILILTLLELLNKRTFPRLEGIIDFIPVVMILVWFYGIFLGVIKNNPPVFILSNFAGMSLYFIYYAFRSFKLDALVLFKIVFFAGLVNVAYSFGALYVFGFEKMYLGIGIHTFRVYYSVGLLVTTPIISLLIAKYVFGKNKFLMYSKTRYKYLEFVILVCFIVSLVVLSASKGNFLILVAICFLFLFAFICRLLLYGRLVKSGFGYIIISFFSLILIIFVMPDIIDILLFNFSDMEASNKTRSEQKIQILRQIEFFGAGLGASLEGGHIRNDVFPYAYELSYFNLMHKVGFLSLIPILIYTYTCAIAWIGVVKLNDLFYPSLAIGAMMFLIPSYGNPILFSPISVTLHCLALFWLKKVKL